MPGYNDLWTTAPEIAKCLVNPEDGYRVTKWSGKILEFQCPECGHVRQRSVNQVSRRGFVCGICGLGVSYPNRVMAALLNYLGVDYEREKSFEWSNRKRYDFFVAPTMIIEMFGEQHYNGFSGESFTTYGAIHKNDIDKLEMAISHGYNRYVIVDASRSNIEYISQAIKDSMFNAYFDISNVDWGIIDKIANRHVYKDFVAAYNSGLSVTDIAHNNKIVPETVRKILKIGTKNGDCVYNGKEIALQNALNNLSRCAEQRKKKIRCVTTGKEFDSVNDAANYYNISAKALSGALTGRAASSGKIDGMKLYWEYLKEE